MKKNILIALPNDQLGGAEQYLKNIVIHYYKKQFNVTILFLTKKKFNGWENLEDKVRLIYSSGKSTKKGLFQFLINIINLRHIKFDYIYTSHVHITGLIGFSIKLKILKTNKFIGRESTLIFDRFKGLKLFSFKLSYLLGYSSLDLLVCQTRLMKERFIESLPKLSKKIKIKVIPNPINLDLVIDNKKIDENLGRFIVSAGRLIDVKGFDILINAFKKIKIQKPNLKLVILGEGKDRNKLEELISKLGLHKDVLLIGFVKNVFPYFEKADACVVSSRIEGFPNVLLQMMSQNTKVISTKCAGDIETIDGIILSDVEDVDSLYEAILYSLNNNFSENRLIFNKQLDNRKIDNFIEKINSFINE